MGFKQSFLICFIFLFFCFSSAICAEPSENPTEPPCTSTGGCKLYRDKCHAICGCHRAIKYNEATGDCVVDNNFLRLLADNYNTQGRFKAENHSAFRGIIISAIIFVACVSTCVLFVCVYCCRLHYSDRRLKKNVKELARKLRINYPKESIPMSTVKPPSPVAESCNVVVADADVMCV